MRQTHLSDPDLIAFIDEQLVAARAENARLHLDGCSKCQTRHDAMLAARLVAFRAVQDASAAPAARHAASRVSLRQRLDAAANPETHTMPSGRTVGLWTRWAAAAAVVLMAATIVVNRGLTRQTGLLVEYDALPIKHVTPGATAVVSLAQLCGHPAPDPEPADPSVRQQVLAAYGMAHVPEHEYELDYLITPALGGANDLRNLWPERYSNRRWNAKVKDQLEALLPGLVCDGKVDLQTAQRDIAADWVAAYKKYFKTDVPLGSS